jgi:hypothetical protein
MDDALAQRIKDNWDLYFGEGAAAREAALVVAQG